MRFDEQQRRRSDGPVSAGSDGVVDAHLHAVDFLQQELDPHELLRSMDEHGVDRVVAFGLPYKKKWARTEPHRPRYYLDDEARCYPWVATDDQVARWAEAFTAPSRLAVTCCGIEPTDLDAARRLDRLLTDGPFVGVGELLLRHGRLSSHLADEVPTGDHEAVRRIVDVCAQHGVPLIVHQNAGATGQGPDAYLSEMEVLLSWDPSVPVVWAHAGTTGEHIGVPPATVARLLADHPQLVIDLSWSATDRLVPHGGDAIDDEWVELVAGFDQRFVWGSDSVGAVEHLVQRLGIFRRFLAALPPASRRAVAAQNAERIWFDR